MKYNRCSIYREIGVCDKLLTTNDKRDKQLLLNTFAETIDNPNALNEKLEQSHRVMDGLKELIELCGDDPERDGLEETPYRVLKAFLEYTEGYREDPTEDLKKTFDVTHREIVLLRYTEVYSSCKHAFAAFFAGAHVGYIRHKKISGLSKIARIVEGYAKRCQVQQRLTTQIAKAMEEILEPKGTMVVI